MQIDCGSCKNFTFEKLDSKYILSALQRVVSTCKRRATAGSTIKVHSQSSCSRVYSVNLGHEVLAEIHVHFMLGAMGSLG